jgi:hypothetical protein
MEQWGQVECELSKLSPTLHEKTFCKCLIGSVNAATAYHDNVDEAMEKHKASLLMPDRLSKDAWSGRTVKEVEHWFTNGEGYLGCDDAAWSSNSNASNVKMVES